MMRKLQQKGQSTVEAVLILVVIIGIAAMVSTAFRSNEFIASIVSGPWRNLSGMIQNGVWRDPASSMEMHPNYFIRHASQEGDAAR